MVSDAPEGVASLGGEGESTKVLRAKYDDYCSARVAEVLLALTPDDMYLLAQRAAQEAATSESLSYEEMVELATERVTGKLSLPSFEVWVQQYREDPSRFDAELLGLWESEIEQESESSGSIPPDS